MNPFRLLVTLLKQLQEITGLFDAKNPASLGTVAGNICYLNIDDAEEVEKLLIQRGFSIDGYRLMEEVNKLHQAASTAMKGPFVAKPTPDDLRQANLHLASLRDRSLRLYLFLGKVAEKIKAVEERERAGVLSDEGNWQHNTTKEWAAELGVTTQTITGWFRKKSRGFGRSKTAFMSWTPSTFSSKTKPGNSVQENK